MPTFNILMSFACVWFFVFLNTWCYKVNNLVQYNLKQLLSVDLLKAGNLRAFIGRAFNLRYFPMCLVCLHGNWQVLCVVVDEYVKHQ